MHSLFNHGLQCIPMQLPSAHLKLVRNASLTSAISRGLRKGANNLDRLGTAPKRSKEDAKPQGRRSTTPRTRLEVSRLLEPVRRQPNKKWLKERQQRSIISTEAPLGIPYTTAGSEFLYGAFAVKAAIQAQRRRLHRLYVWKGENSSADDNDETILKLATAKRVNIMEVAGSWDKMLMKMSGQRPHNGYVLEASPIPKLPITSLNKLEHPDNNLVVSVPHQSTEDQVVNTIFQVKDSLATLLRPRDAHRYPLLLWLDRVTDTGNLGAIIRTAYFFGVRAILIPEHGTAPFGPITVKASAGTAEYLPIFTVKKELDFVRSSQEQGWKFFAAAAPENTSSKRKGRDLAHSDIAAGALDESPCVLMVGNEGEGLRGFMQKAADKSISIPGATDPAGVVDSLNVSVAAALLVSRFLIPTPASPSTASNNKTQIEPASNSKSSNVF